MLTTDEAIDKINNALDARTTRAISKRVANSKYSPEDLDSDYIISILANNLSNSPNSISFAWGDLGAASERDLSVIARNIVKTFASDSLRGEIRALNELRDDLIAQVHAASGDPHDLRRLINEAEEVDHAKIIKDLVGYHFSNNAHITTHMNALDYDTDDDLDYMWLIKQILTQELCPFLETIELPRTHFYEELRDYIHGEIGVITDNDSVMGEAYRELNDIPRTLPSPELRHSHSFVNETTMIMGDFSDDDIPSVACAGGISSFFMDHK